MKKRSLFAAVAMLIVSAIVLTSATYAWFSASDSAEVQFISATVTNDDGSILLTATGTNVANANPTTTLTGDYYTNLTDTLTPVSFSFDTANAEPTIKKVLFDGSNFTLGSAQANNSTVNNETVKGDYIYFQYQISYATTSGDAKTIQLTPALTNAYNCDFGYVLVRVKPYGASGYTNYIYAKTTATGSYTPVAALTGTIVDDKTDDDKVLAILDATDDALTGGSWTPGNAVNSISPAAITAITVPSHTGGTSTTYTADVQVYIWAEGNDTDCVGAVTSATTGIKFDVGFAS
jgi:predicted ribosomally synthesized peptide with SipW-like signal peptide